MNRTILWYIIYIVGTLVIAEMTYSKYGGNGNTGFLIGMIWAILINELRHYWIQVYDHPRIKKQRRTDER